MRDLVAPAPKLRVQIVDIGEGPGGEEGVAEVVDLALDLALLIGARRAYRAAARSDNGRRARASADESESRCPRVRARHCADCRRPGCGRRPATPAKASTWPRRKLSSVWSSVKSAKTAREYDEHHHKAGERPRRRGRSGSTRRRPSRPGPLRPAAWSSGDRPWRVAAGRISADDAPQLHDRAGVAARRAPSRRAASRAAADTARACRG